MNFVVFGEGKTKNEELNSTMFEYKGGIDIDNLVLEPQLYQLVPFGVLLFQLNYFLYYSVGGVKYNKEVAIGHFIYYFHPHLISDNVVIQKNLNPC